VFADVRRSSLKQIRFYRQLEIAEPARHREMDWLPSKDPSCEYLLGGNCWSRLVEADIRTRYVVDEE